MRNVHAGAGDLGGATPTAPPRFVGRSSFDGRTDDGNTIQSSLAAH
jgi:hypothetical protein